MLTARAAEMREAGLLIREIAAELGISRGYAAEVIRDPDGSQRRARLATYSRPCPECGAAMTGSGPSHGAKLCASCHAARQHAEREWTAEKIIETFQAFEAHYGRPPVALDTPLGLSPSQASRLSATRVAETRAIQDGPVRLPQLRMVAREFGSWNDAIRAAGFQPTRGGSPLHRDR